MGLHALVLLLCTFYGSVFAFGKLTLEYAPAPLFVTGSRMVLAGLLLLGYQFLFHRETFSLKLNKQTLWPVIIIAIFGVYLTNAFEFWGLQFMEAGKACFLYSFSPIATALLSYFCFREHITLQKWVGLGVGILGFLPLLMAPMGITEDTSGTIGFLSFAEISILIAAIATSIGWIAMRGVVKKGYSLIMANALSMIIGGLFSFGHSFLVESWDPTPITDLMPFLQWFLILTLISNLISYNLHAVLLRHYTATYLSFAGLTQPLFAALFGWIFLQEVMSEYFWISIIAVSIGLYLYYQEELKLGHAPKRDVIIDEP